MLGPGGLGRAEPPAAGPRAVLLSGDDEDPAYWRNFFIAAGCRPLNAIPIAEAPARLDALVAVDLVWCCTNTALPEAVIARLQHMTASGECGLAVEAPAEAIDAMFAAFPGDNIMLMSDPGLVDRNFALMALLGTRQIAVHDPAAEPDPLQLQRLRDEVQRMAETLAALTGPTPYMPGANGHGAGSALQQPRRGYAGPAVGPRPVRACQPLRAADIRAIIRRRRLRDQFFAGEIFADPAWDILLDLMAARLDAKEVSVSSLCIAAAVPATTALRWIRGMTDAGLLVRHADPYDGRRVFIALSDEAAAAMEHYFAAINAPGEAGPV